MAQSPLNIVRKALQTYADRGVFRGFSEATSGRFTFIWLAQSQMELRVDTIDHVMRFKQLLPCVPSGSMMYHELKGFIQQRYDRELPDHRRIDRRQAEVSCTNRGGFVSISLKVKNNHYAYGVNRIVNLVHELFLYLREVYPEYLTENFDVPQE